MLPPDQLDRFVLVLVRARNPNNIGAVARAMHDFGFRHLRLVSDYPVPYAGAKSAVDASLVLEEAREYAGLAEAVADCTLVVGTTAVGARKLEHTLETLPAAAPLLRAALAESGQRVALLFGSEKTGLSNEELSFCDWLLTIPMQAGEGRHLSMNLGQAAAVCLFDLVREGKVVLAEGAERAPAADGERLTLLLSEVLDAAGYRKHHPAHSDPAQLRRLVHRLTLNRQDAMVWMGIWRQLLWKLRSDRRSDGAAKSGTAGLLPGS